MANGLLAKAALVASTYTQVGQVPVGESGTVNIRIVNRHLSNPAPIRLAIVPSTWVAGAPSNEDYIEPVDLVIPASGVLEETAMAIGSLEQVVAYSTSSNVTVRVFGYLK